MHNVNLEALNQTVEKAREDPSVVCQQAQTRALGLSDRPSVEQIDWQLEIDADADPEKLEELKRLADEHCSGVLCLRNQIELHTRLQPGSPAS
jgi:uncharacterized OsmC-like protein